MFRKITSLRYLKRCLIDLPLKSYVPSHLCTINTNVGLRNFHISLDEFPKNIYLIDESDESEAEETNLNRYTVRTYNCGELRQKHVAEMVILCGWLEYQRMNKFIVIRDSYGHSQLLLKENDMELQEILKTLPLESIIQVKGKVQSRPKEMINPKQPTGEIEILVDSINVLNRACDKLPFNIRGYQMAKESLRMQYRYLSLRFPDMQKNLRMRSEFLMAMRNFLAYDMGFVEVETPTLFKATPGGAQEFVVPTQFPGQFYSLVQSPQQFKQMLMAGAIDRYFQIARCYRDEGSRSDRQPEFTQLDIEMTFTSADGVTKLVEELLHHSWPKTLSRLPRTFPRITYKEALEKYGTDKPDLRYDFLLHDCTDVLKQSANNAKDFWCGCLIFDNPYHSYLTKSTREKFHRISRRYNEVKLVQYRIKIFTDWINYLSNLLGNDISKNLTSKLNLKEKSAILLAYGKKYEVLSLLAQLRLEYIKLLEEQGHKLRKLEMCPVWVTNFPLFEEGDSSTLVSAHHPFTSPNVEDLPLLSSEPLKVKAQAYDLVLNGNEVGGGSIRIHDPNLQKLIFEKLNIDTTSMQHIIDMLSSGCPPHGGIALGIDRLLAVMLNTTSIRDVIAFPKTHEGRDPLSGAPSSIPDEVKKLYHIKSIK